MLNKAVSSSAAMKKLTTDENIDKAKGNPLWTYQFFFDLVKLTAYEDYRTSNRSNKTKRNVNAHGTSSGRGRGGRGNKSGRGNNDSPDKDRFEKMDKEGASKAGISLDQYKKLPNTVKSVIRNNNSDTTKVNTKHGKINVEKDIWDKLSAGAKKSIHFHNNNIKSTNSQTSVNNTTQVQHQTQDQQVKQESSMRPVRFSQETHPNATPAL